jgi:hypothetical protein
MPSVPAHVQEISINWIRQEAMVVARGYIILLGISGMPLFILLSSIVRDLPRFGAAKLLSPELWFWAGLYALSALAVPACVGPFCKRCLGGLLALQTLVLLFAGAMYGPHIPINFARIGQEPAVAAVAGLLLLILAVMLYWIALSPALAAIRLLATRLPPDDVPLPTMMATLEQTRTRPRALPSRLRRIAARAQALRAIAYLALLAALVVALWEVGHWVQLVQLDPDLDTVEVKDLLAFLSPLALELALRLGPAAAAQCAARGRVRERTAQARPPCARPLPAVVPG